MKILSILLIAFLSLSVFAEAPAYKNLSETELFSNIKNHTIKPNIMFYSPQYPLWTDGATKKRFAYIPEGKKINTTNMDRWIYPNGTKIWKEFSFQMKDGPKRIETRLIEKAEDGKWYYFTFLWNKDETEAVIAPSEGIKNYVPINDKVAHDIPSSGQCQACHGFQNEPLMSFAALQLSPDRDPAGLHQDPLQSDMTTLKDLAEKNKLTHYPIEWPRIKSNNIKERRVIGYLHGNCSSCHRVDGVVGPLGMELLYEVNKTHENQGFFNTALNVKTRRFKIPNLEMKDSYRIHKAHPEQSAILIRANSRGNINQMAPFGSKLVDEDFVTALREYIVDQE